MKRTYGRYRTEFDVVLIAGKLAENERLYGPASLKDKTLIYPCAEFKCRLGFPCQMFRNKLTHCDDFEDHEAFHRANRTQSRYCNNLSLQGSSLKDSGLNLEAPLCFIMATDYL